MNSSQRFASSPWESSLVTRYLVYKPFSDFSISLCLHVLASTFPHMQNSLTHYTRSTQLQVLFLLLVDLSCPVSCKFPHGTLHYQSYKFSILVGGSTLFNPYFMYEFISIRTPTLYGLFLYMFWLFIFSTLFLLRLSSHLIPTSSVLPLLCVSYSVSQKTTQTKDQIFYNLLFASITDFARHYFRSLC